MAKLYTRKSDGTYVPYNPQSVTNIDVVQATGDSVTAAMSQDAVTKELATKQDALTPGNGISIEGGVISSSIAETVDNIVNAGYVFAGVATPSTNPGTPNAKVFYIANGKGTYTNFRGLEVTEDEVVILYYDIAWHKVATGIASQEKLTELDAEIVGGKIMDTEEISVSMGFYNTVSAVVGNSYTPILASSTDVAATKIQVKKGDIVTIHGNTKSSNAVRLYVLCDTNNIVTLVGESSGNFLIEPKVLNIEGDGILYINLSNYASVGGKVELSKIKSVSGIKPKLEELENQASRLSSNLSTTQENVSVIMPKVEKNQSDINSLNKQINGDTEYVTTEQQVTTGFFNTVSAVVGDTFSMTQASSSDIYSAKFEVKSGDIVTIQGKAKGSNATRLYVLCDNSNIVTELGDSLANFLDSPKVVKVLTDGYIYVNLSYYTTDGGKVELTRTIISGDSLANDVAVLQEDVNDLKNKDVETRTIAFIQGNKLYHKNLRHPFSWAQRTKGVIAIKSDDLTSDVDLVAKIMAERNLPLHLAAPTNKLTLPVDGITTPSEKIGTTRLDIVHYVIEHGGEIMEHSDNTFTSEDYWDVNGIYHIFVKQQKIWAELGINVRGAWVANNFPTEGQKKALAPYLYYYYEYSNGYGDNPPYSTVSKINDGSVSSPTSYESFKSFIDNVIAGNDFGTITIHGFSIITSTLFEQVLDYIQQKVADGVLDVKTWGEVYDASKID